jgi:pilus assembly protein Flp/PilA
MIKFLRTFARDEAGATAAEYALIIGIIGSGIAVAAVALGGSISTGMGNVGKCITTKGVTC